MGEMLKTDSLIDNLADKAGGYFAFPSEDSMEYTDLFFYICQKYKIHYSSATPKEKYFVDEVTRVTWERFQCQKGKAVDVRPAFSQLSSHSPR